MLTDLEFAFIKDCMLPGFRPLIGDLRKPNSIDQIRLKLVSIGLIGSLNPIHVDHFENILYLLK